MEFALSIFNGVNWFLRHWCKVIQLFRRSHNQELGGVMKMRQVRLAIASVVFLLIGAWYTSANALPVPISECNVTACFGTPTEGWDGPGLGAVTIDYFVGNPGLPNFGLPFGISLADFDAAISAAQAIWSSVVQVDWNRLGDGINDAIDWSVTQSVIYAASGDHGDGNPFDGAWNPNTGSGFVLAHAYGPPDIAVGNLHLDNSETWVTSGASIGTNSASIDLLSILAHEFGHVLGLGHPSGNAGDLMQPLYYGPLTALSGDDIAAVRTLYACRGEGCGDGGDGEVTVPEPGTLVLFGIGLLGLGWSRRQKLC
jgi:hypothetical protein